MRKAVYVAYSFVTQETRDISHTDLMYHPFLALKQNPGCHTFKDDRELETPLTFSLVTRDRE
jgi:hypothetical protein